MEPLVIHSVTKNILDACAVLGWKIDIEDDGPDFKNYFCANAEGFCEAFTLMELVIMSPELNSADSDGVYITFLFYADPAKIPADRQKFGKMLRSETANTLQALCDNIMQSAEISVTEASVTVNRQSGSSRLKFGGSDYVSPAYTVDVCYQFF